MRTNSYYIIDNKTSVIVYEILNKYVHTHIRDLTEDVRIIKLPCDVPNDFSSTFINYVYSLADKAVTAREPLDAAEEDRLQTLCQKFRFISNLHRRLDEFQVKYTKNVTLQDRVYQMKYDQAIRFLATENQDVAKFPLIAVECWESSSPDPVYHAKLIKFNYEEQQAVLQESEIIRRTWMLKLKKCKTFEETNELFKQLLAQVLF